ncbi:hypothetical protein CYMTET_17388 [Cymbomonas tetramitiformis]|uniref:Uncharacterized protein n=1 Tax=Cymbomonas tetramitiformis TaxID=36881 RepID=A0AAE0L763_9CHLO|nr:hypothetical protein CYMTET_17388 [Cymbomonas tetramitiformis]
MNRVVSETYEADPAKCRLVIKSKKGKAVNKKRCELLTAARCEWTKVEEVVSQLTRVLPHKNELAEIVNVRPIVDGDLGLITIDETDQADEENPFVVGVEEEAEDIEEPEGQAANEEGPTVENAMSGNEISGCACFIFTDPAPSVISARFIFHWTRRHAVAVRCSFHIQLDPAPSSLRVRCSFHIAGPAPWWRVRCSFRIQ